jgi:RimJ/RimL family protein N-acetyltransferase
VIDPAPAPILTTSRLRLRPWRDDDLEPYAAPIGAPFMPCVELGYRLAFAHGGRGYATEGARAALAFGFDTVGLPEIVAIPAALNERSRGVMERLGMTRNPAEDFDYPTIAAGHRLRRHVLYRLSAAEWSGLRYAGCDSYPKRIDGS